MQICETLVMCIKNHLVSKLNQSFGSEAFEMQGPTEKDRNPLRCKKCRSEKTRASERRDSCRKGNCDKNTKEDHQHSKFSLLAAQGEKTFNNRFLDTAWENPIEITLQRCKAEYVSHLGHSPAF